MAQTGDAKKANEEQYDMNAENIHKSPKSEVGNGSEEMEEDAIPDEKETLKTELEGNRDEGPTETTTDIKTELEETSKGNSGKCDLCS